MPPSLTLLYSPFPSTDAARAAAAALLDARLVACCNLLPGTESHYRWEGERISSTETILIAKTIPEHAPQAAQLLASIHPYKCPAILTLAATALAPFADWVGAMTTDSQEADKQD